jgi:coenzyme F420-dependent glucose-6-phosphate dehydrogenase
MVLYAYHASHAQFTPTALVRYVRLAEQAGFTAISSSEHLQPWSPRQGQSGFAWAWLGAAMQVTFLPFSVVCAPGQRLSTRWSSPRQLPPSPSCSSAVSDWRSGAGNP